MRKNRRKRGKKRMSCSAKEWRNEGRYSLRVCARKCKKGRNCLRKRKTGKNRSWR
jgi:hypothetical protein